MEEKVSKLATEVRHYPLVVAKPRSLAESFRSLSQKAKADNKYFAAMRTKEAVEVERKVAQRNVEKQSKVLEKLSESERNLMNQLVSRVWPPPLSSFV